MEWSSYVISFAIASGSAKHFHHTLSRPSDGIYFGITHLNDIAIFQTSTREDLVFQLKFNNIELAGRELSVELIERNTGVFREMLTIGDGLALEDASTVTARLSKAAMSGWPKGEYQADLLDITGGQLTRLMAVRLIYNEPGRLVNGVKGNQATINWAPNQSTVTAIGGVGPAGPANALTIGDVDTLETGEDATAEITGSAPNQVLNLGLPKGNTGATGAAGTITIGGVTTGAPGSDVIIDNTGTPENAVLDITIPRGDVGATGAAATIAIGDVTTSLPGSDAEVTNVGTSGAAIFDFVIPRGEQGPPGSVVDGDKGDITVSGGGTVWTVDAGVVGTAKIADDAVTFDKAQNIATARMLGRKSAGSGNIEELTAADARSLMQVAPQVSGKTGAYTVVVGDFGKTFVATGSASWSFSLPAAATAGANFAIEFRNSGTGVIAIDPDAAELINGATVLRVYRDDAVKLVCDGSAWHALFQSPFSVVAAGTLGSAVSTVDLSLPGEFKQFKLDLDGFEPSTAAALGMRLSIDGGTSFYSGSGAYAWVASYDSSATTNSTTYKPAGSVFTTTGLELTPGIQGAASGAAMSAEVVIMTRATSRYGSVRWFIASTSNPMRGVGYLGVSTSDINALRLLYSAGNIVAGSKYTLIGQRG